MSIEKGNYETEKVEVEKVEEEIKIKKADILKELDTRDLDAYGIDIEKFLSEECARFEELPDEFTRKEWDDFIQRCTEKNISTQGVFKCVVNYNLSMMELLKDIRERK